MNRIGYADIESHVEREGRFSWKATVTATTTGAGLPPQPSAGWPCIWTMGCATRWTADRATKKLVAYLAGEREHPGAFVFVR